MSSSPRPRNHRRGADVQFRGRWPARCACGQAALNCVHKRLWAARPADRAASPAPQVPGPHDLALSSALGSSFPAKMNWLRSFKRQLFDPARRNAWSGRRIRQRQVDDGTCAARPRAVAGQSDRGQHPVWRPRSHGDSGRGNEPHSRVRNLHYFPGFIGGFSPVHTIGQQLAEPLKMHKGLSEADAMKRVIELLDLVGVPNASNRVKDYPHQFSGGMRATRLDRNGSGCGPKVAGRGRAHDGARRDDPGTGARSAGRLAKAV